ncbi:PAS domain-containing protein [Marivibrio halodurans]|uniref:PAS domain-containing protein n=1 Tax=Marivibrio halodurans TaxID=2039722 RepID=A0A8J7RWR1_9PROT|nr:PAS domain-containing protein [Marivibrio halodurans]MBP5856142.1 PAS domain-containing protein [Marivibrio halodurans]
MDERSAFLDRLHRADTRLVAFLDAWAAARDGAPVPRKTAFDPLAVAALLPMVWLYRYEPALGDFVCRLAGESVNQAWGHSIRGMTLRQVVGKADHPTILGRWREIVGTPFIHYGGSRERLSAQSVYQAHRLLMPLAGEAEGMSPPDYVIGISLYHLDPMDRDRMPLMPEDIVRLRCDVF